MPKQKGYQVRIGDYVWASFLYKGMAEHVAARVRSEKKNKTLLRKGRVTVRKIR
jgi:hypothetical protein